MRYIVVLLLAALGVVPAAFARVDALCEDLLRAGFEEPLAQPSSGPAADAGADQSVLPGEQVTLNGSASTGGTPLAHCWRLMSTPPGSGASLSDNRAVAPTLITDAAGDYVARLTVHDGQTQSPPSFVTIGANDTSAMVTAAQGGAVVSPDGRLALDIPPGAVGSDMEIGIRMLSSDELSESFNGVPVVAGYELTPDGITFSQPVNASFRMSGAGDAPLVAVVESNGNLEVPDGLMAMPGADQRLSAELDHFSRLILIRLAFVTVNADPVMGTVGQPFTAAYTVNASASGPATLSVVTRKEGPYATAPVLSRPFIFFNPVVTSLAYGTDVNLSFPAQDMATGTVTGQCTNPGTSEFTIELEVSGNALAFIFNNGNLDRASVVQVRFPVTCADNRQPPVANDDRVRLPFGVTTATIPVLGNDSDDGTLDPATVNIVDQPRSGTLSLNPDGSLTYTAGSLVVFRFTSDRFTYTVQDDDGLVSNVAWVELNRSFASNQQPVANDDSATTPADEPINIRVLANDTDDGTLDPGSVEQRSSPPGGSIVLNTDGSFTYTPTTGFSGVDQFRYRVSDNEGAFSNDASVFITVGNPTVADAVDDEFDASSGLTQNLDVLANDRGQIDGSTLTILQQPFLGPATVQEVGGKFVIQYMPQAGEARSDNLLYQVGNGSGQFDNAFVQLRVTDPNNTPPVAIDDQASTPTETPVQIFTLNNDFDPDGLLTVVTPDLVTAPANGTAVPIFGGFEYTPNPGFVGQDQFSYRFSDPSGGVSNTAVAFVDVFIQNDPPVANDDLVTVAVDGSLTFSVTANDTDVDGNLVPTTVGIVTPPSNGTATVELDGRVTYVPDPGYTGPDQLSYNVADARGEVSNTATVDITVADFAGSDQVPTDNISVAQLHFFAIFGDTFVNQGAGSFLGFYHATDDALMNLTQISDYTWLFQIPQPSDPAAEDSYNFMTDLQSGTATYSQQFGVFRFDGFTSGELFNPTGGDLTVTASDGSPTDMITAPPHILDGNDQPTIFRGPFQGLSTEVQFPDGQFTHLVIRFISRFDNTIGGVIARIPAEAMTLDTATGMRFRQILDPTAQAALAVRGIQPDENVAFVFYNQRDTTEFFTAQDQRPVPLAAGRGVSVPASQLRDPVDFCAAVPTSGTQCAGGPREVLLATNQNGDVTMHSPVDGAYQGNLLGDGAPNFVVDSGWHTVQDPNTNCLLVSDSDNDAIHQYDTDGSLVQQNFIDTMDGGGPGGNVLGDPRGLAFLDGDLLVALNTQGRILRFDSNGSFIDEYASNLGQPNGIAVAPNGDLLVSDEGETNPMDRVLIVRADDRANPETLLGMNLSTPYQITPLLQGNFAMANFGFADIRIFDDGFPQIGNVALGMTDTGATRSPRGVFPLTNGNWLITADDGVGVATIDPLDAANTLNTLVVGSTYRFISRACLPE